jgi:hypothetical protein
MATNTSPTNRTSFWRLTSKRTIKEPVQSESFLSFIYNTEESRMVLAAIRLWVDLIITYPIWIIYMFVFDTLRNIYESLKFSRVTFARNVYARDHANAAPPTSTSCSLCSCNHIPPTSTTCERCNACYDCNRDLELFDLGALFDDVEIIDSTKMALVAINLPAMICAFYCGSLMTILWTGTLYSIFLVALVCKTENEKLSAEIKELQVAKERKDNKEEKKTEEVKEATEAAHELDFDMVDDEDL